MLQYIQKHKQKLLKYTKPILLGFSLISLLLLAEPTYAFLPFLAAIPAVVWWVLGGIATGAAVTAWAHSLGGFAEAFVKLMVDILNMIAGVIIDVIMPITLTVFNNVVDAPNYLLELDITISTWSLILTVANGFFLLALLIASIAIILRINTGVYNIKKFLGGFIAAVVLSNLSLLIVKALVGIGDVLSSIIQTSFGGTDIIGKLAATGETAAPSALSGDLIPAVFYMIMLILIFFIILKLTLILVERMLWVFMLALVAPIAFALGLLPVTQKLTSQWWEALIKWILVLPITLGLVSLAVRIMTSGSGNIDTLGKDLLLGSNSSDPEQILPIVTGLVVLYIAGTAGKMLNVGGALSGIVGDNAFQGIGKLGKLYKGIADTATGKSWAGKQLHRRGQDVYNIGMANKTLRGLEAKRRTLKGPLGRVLNPTRERGRIEFEREKGAEGIHPQEIGIRLNNVRKNQASLDKIVAQGYGAGKDWDSLSDIEQSNLKDSNKTVKNLLKNIGADQGAANKFIQDASPKPTELDPTSVLEITAQNSKKSTGERAIAIHGIRNIARNQGRPDRYQAREWLDANKEIIKNIGLDPRKYESKKVTGSEKLTDIRSINAQKQLDSAKAERVAILNKLSELGLSQKMAQKIKKEGIPLKARGLTGIDITTLITLMNKEGLDVKNMTRMTTIKEAVGGPDDRAKERKALLIIDMLNSGTSIKEMVAYKKLGSEDLGDENMQSTYIQGLLEKLSSTETSQQQSEKTISEIKNIHLEQVDNVKRVVRENIKVENLATTNTVVTRHYNNISNKIKHDSSIQKVKHLDLAPEEKEEIYRSITDAKAGLSLDKDMSELPAGDLLRKLRLVRDATAEEN